MHRAKGDRLVRASVLPVCDNGVSAVFTHVRNSYLHTEYVHLIFYPGIEVPNLSMSSYPGCHVMVTPSCYGFKDKNAVFNGEQKRIHYLCGDVIENSVPRDHRLS